MEGGNIKRLEEFCVVLKTGVMQQPADCAAVVFRNYLLRTTKKSYEHDRYKKGQAALLAFLDKEKITKLYRCEEDLFPAAALTGMVPF